MTPVLLRGALAAILALGLAAGRARAQTTIRVPADHATIQSAIDAARDRDVILVWPGAYRENLDFQGKAIQVHSTHGPARTVIDGGHRGSTVTFRSGEGPDTLLSGFTVTGGSGTGAGLFRLGGGVYCLGSSPVIGHCVLRGNTASGPFGQGGGLYAEGGRLTVVGCDFERNLASSSGGGLATVDASPIITRCRFIENHADLGGGAYFSRGAVTLWNSAFLRNSARGGGGLYSRFEPATPKHVIHTTFTGNRGAQFGGALASASETLRVANAILWDNEAPAGPELWLGRDYFLLAPSRVEIRASAVRNGTGGVEAETGAALAWGPGMIAVDPLLVDPAAGDVHLRHDSPGRDAGDATVSPLPDLDLDGDPRALGSAPDMGADEWAPRLYGASHAVRGARLQQTLVGPPGGIAMWALSLKGLDPGLAIPGLGTLFVDPATMVLVPAGTFPTSGVVPLSIALPRVFPVEYLLTQALAGPVLTNAPGIYLLDPPSP